jgi:putative membrane protein
MKPLVGQTGPVNHVGHFDSCHAVCIFLFPAAFFEEEYMQQTVFESFSGLYAFFGYFGGSALLLVLFCLVYLRVTPYAELRLVREGKTAPAVSFGGALIGFVLPLASAITHSVSFVDMALWALVALVVQILVFIALKTCLSGLVNDIAEDRMGPAIVVAVFSIAAGLLNAACMSW